MRKIIAIVLAVFVPIVLISYAIIAEDVWFALLAVADLVATYAYSMLRVADGPEADGTFYVSDKDSSDASLEFNKELSDLAAQDKVILKVNVVRTNTRCE